MKSNLNSSFTVTTR